MSAADKNNQRLIVGGVPRADLLPPEIKQDKVAGRQRSNLIAGLILVVFLVAVAYGGSAFLAIGANASLVAEQQRSADLLAEQAEYSEVRQLQAQLSAAQASLLVASAAEVDWSPLLSDYYATLPAGSTVQSLGVTLITGSTAQVVSPLYETGVVEIIAVVETPTVPDSAAWLSRLNTLPGFADWTPSAVTQSLNGYTTTVTVHLGLDAAWARYFPTDDAETSDEEEETAP
jgi:hypothetical protein